MFKRPFTCVFKGSGGVAACIIEAPDGAERAHEVAQEKLPRAEIIAMIPGIHAAHMYTYNEPRKATTLSEPGGPWPDNLPPGF